MAEIFTVVYTSGHILAEEINSIECLGSERNSRIITKKSQDFTNTHM